MVYEKIGDAFQEIWIEPLNKGDNSGCGSSLKGVCASTLDSIPAEVEPKKVIRVFHLLFVRVHSKGYFDNQI